MKKFFNIVNRCEMFLAAACIAVFTLVVFAGAVARLFKHPLNWSMDISLFLLTWCTFLGGDLAFRSGRLVNVGLLLEKIPARLQKLFVLVVYAILCVFLGAMVVYGVMLCGTTVNRTFNGMPGFSYMWVTLSIPVCCTLMLLTAIDRFIGLMKSNDRQEVSKM